MCREYNGYPNYETWLCQLWIDNDEGLNDLFMEQAEEINAASQYPRSELAGVIKDWVEENNPIDSADLFSDLLNSAISTIDFYFIADNYLETVKENLLAEAIEQERE